MQYTTKAEKAIAEQWVHRYVNSKHQLSIRQYTRLMCWLGGDTFKEIAAADGVTEQAIANSVRRDLKKVQKFAKENDK